MNCVEVADLLARIEAAAGGVLAPGDEGMLAALAAAGLVASSAPEAAPADDGRARLAELADRRAGLRLLVGAATDPAERIRLRADLLAVEKEEREVRAAVLGAAERAVRQEGGARAGSVVWSVTYRGRDLCGEISSRRRRLAGVPVATFEAEMTALRTALGAAAKRASQALAVLSPALDPIDEALCRAAAIGIAGAPPAADASVLLSLYRGLASGPAGPVALALAEAMVLAGVTEVAAVEAKWRGLRPACTSDDDAADATAVLIAAPSARRADVETRAGAIARGLVPGPAAPAFLVAATDVPTEEATARIRSLEATALVAGAGAGSSRLVAALLALAPVDADTAVARWLALDRWLRAFADTDTSVLAAMSCLVDAEPDEVLDDLRLACAAVHGARVSMGATENLALGTKLLLLTGARTASQPGLAAALPVPTLSPRLAPAVSSFHAPSIHRAVDHDHHTHRSHRGAVFG